MAIRREIAAIMSRLHRVDLQRAMDPMAGMAGSSMYMKDLVDKLSFIKTGIFGNVTPEVTQTWYVFLSHDGSSGRRRPTDGHGALVALVFTPR